MLTYAMLTYAHAWGSIRVCMLTYATLTYAHAGGMHTPCKSHLYRSMITHILYKCDLSAGLILRIRMRMLTYAMLTYAHAGGMQAYSPI